MATLLRLVFLDDCGKEHELHFALYATDLVNRWVEITKKNQQTPDSRINARFTNISYNQISKVRTRLTDCLTRINSVYDEPLPLYTEISELTTPELNYLHEEFERYGDRFEDLMRTTDWWSQELHEDFLELNEIIHLHEDLLYVKKGGFPNMALLYDYYPQGLHLPILERDKLWLTPTLQWGEVYLGYNTLGKDWFKVVADKDLEVIERDQVRPQERFAAETWINFGPDSDGWEIRQLEKFYDQLPENLQKKVPIDDLNKLNYGRFKLGKIIIDDYFVSRYGGTIADYSVKAGSVKRHWDEHAFSTFVELKEIQFL
jgi:hypothetical protein